LWAMILPQASFRAGNVTRTRLFEVKDTLGWAA
jgi:hypothetical protein